MHTAQSLERPMEPEEQAACVRRYLDLFAPGTRLDHVLSAEDYESYEAATRWCFRG